MLSGVESNRPPLLVFQALATFKSALTLALLLPIPLRRQLQDVLIEEPPPQILLRNMLTASHILQANPLRRPAQTLKAPVHVPLRTGVKER